MFVWLWWKKLEKSDVLVDVDSLLKGLERKAKIESRLMRPFQEFF